MKLTLLSEADIRQALPMPEAIEAMKDAFADFSTGTAHVPQRLRLEVPPADGLSLFKPAYLESGGLGAKIVSVFPHNKARGRPIISGLVVVLDPETGEPAALADGGFVTAWRTGAASGAATDLLARPESRLGAILGCGVQAQTQALAIDAARELDEIRVYARTEADVQRFVEEMAPVLNARLVAAQSSDGAIDGAEVICAATTSKVPVFDGRRLAEGAHINGVGSFTPEMQEVDLETVARSRVFVDSRQSARAEAGELVIAAEARRTRPKDWIELGEVAAGLERGRQSSMEITFFKSVGLAVQDIKACAMALERAREMGLGREIEL